MKVRNLLHLMNIGTSTILLVDVRNVHTHDRILLTVTDLANEEYRDAGSLKVNSYTINRNEMIIYAQ